MIIPLPPLTEEKLNEERNVFEESEIVEINHMFELDPVAGLQLGDDQYIIDPDYAEILGIDNFEDLIKTRR